MSDNEKYQYYWDKKKIEDSNKPIDWDNVIFYTMIVPSGVLFVIIYVVAMGYRGMQ